MDYSSNSKKSKPVAAKAEKKIERVVKGEVIVQKKSLGRKVKDLFIMADLKSVAQYVVADIFLPAARNLIVDASSKGIERIIYGDSVARRRGYSGGPRVTYNSPVSRGIPYGGSPLASRSAPPVDVRSRSRSSSEDFILASREEAEVVLERMNDIIDAYEVVSVADLNDLVGFPTTHIDNKWGWEALGDVAIRQLREGYLIDLPPAQPLG